MALEDIFTEKDFLSKISLSLTAIDLGLRRIAKALEHLDETLCPTKPK